MPRLRAVLFVALSLATQFAWSQESPTPAVVLKLNGSITDPKEIDYGNLPKLTGQHAVVCPSTPELKFQLHDYLLHHDGKYWCLFSHGPEVEDKPTQFVSYATSDDGITWSPAKPVMPRPSEPYAYIARGLWVRDGELLALVAYFRGPGAFGVNKELKLQAYAWDRTTNDWKFKATIYEDAINNFPPQKIGDHWMLSRRDSRFNVFMLVGGTKALDDWESFPVVRRLAIPKFAPDEPFSWPLDDGRIHALFRDNGGSSRLFQAFSSDQGRTWTMPVMSNFPNSSSKFFALKLSTGPWAMISNANPGLGRRQLHLSLSDDGLTFTKMAQLEIPFMRATTFQYPHAIEHDGHLLITFSRKKETTEVLKVPMASITALHQSKP